MAKRIWAASKCFQPADRLFRRNTSIRRQFPHRSPATRFWPAQPQSQFMARTRANPCQARPTPTASLARAAATRCRAAMVTTSCSVATASIPSMAAMAMTCMTRAAEPLQFPIPLWGRGQRHLCLCAGQHLRLHRLGRRGRRDRNGGQDQVRRPVAERPDALELSLHRSVRRRRQLAQFHLERRRVDRPAARRARGPAHRTLRVRRRNDIVQRSSTVTHTAPQRSSERPTATSSWHGTAPTTSMAGPAMTSLTPALAPRSAASISTARRATTLTSIRRRTGTSTSARLRAARNRHGRPGQVHRSVAEGSDPLQLPLHRRPRRRKATRSTSIGAKARGPASCASRSGPSTSSASSSPTARRCPASSTMPPPLRSRSSELPATTSSMAAPATT